MRVEALGLVLRRDPVRERHHQIGGEPQALLADEVEEGRVARRRDARDRSRPAGARRRPRPCLRHRSAGRAPGPPPRRSRARPPPGRRARARRQPTARARPTPDRQSCSSTLPPGNTSAPEAKSISWWRTTMKTSMPSRPSRRITTVAAGRGIATLFLGSHISVFPRRRRAAETPRDRAGTRARHRSASCRAGAPPRCRTRW